MMKRRGKVSIAEKDGVAEPQGFCGINTHTHSPRKIISLWKTKQKMQKKILINFSLTKWSLTLSSKQQLALRFLCNRLALVIHCDSHLSSITLPWQLLSVIKVVLNDQIMLNRIEIPYGHAFWGISLETRRSLVQIQLSAFFFHLICQFK